MTTIVEQEILQLEYYLSKGLLTKQEKERLVSKALTGAFPDHEIDKCDICGKKRSGKTEITYIDHKNDEVEYGFICDYCKVMDNNG